MNYMSGKSYPVNETLKSNVKSNLIKIWTSYKISSICIVKPGTRKQVLILIWLMWNDVWRQIYKIASCKLRAEIKISETQNNLQENIKTSNNWEVWAGLSGN